MSTAAPSPDLPRVSDELVTLKHGSGGRAMLRLIQEVFIPGFAELPVEGVGIREMDDGAALRLGDRWLVVTTDSHVVDPLFFPGGDIGRLAICGTVNDLAMMGATEPLALTSAVIIEEGFRRANLVRIQQSMVEACREASVAVVTGDTKVMRRGELDGIVINTTGVALTCRVIRDAGLRAGDVIILTGSIGDHGIALMARRHGLELPEEVRSDVAPLNGLIGAALRAAPTGVTALKDPTRGGVAGALYEMARKSGVGILIREAAVPISPVVRAAAEMLGLDPFQIANEGKAILGAAPESAPAILHALRAHPLGREAEIVGECLEDHRGRVILDTGFGRRLLPEPEGELLPRIC